VNKCSL